MGLIALYMMTFFFVGMHMVQIFNYALAMGKTRKQMFPMYTLAAFITFLVLAVFMKVLNILEELRLRLMFPGLEIENFVEPMLRVQYLPVYALMGTAFGVLLGASISRFGKAAFWVWWVIFMAVCIGGPRLTHYLTDDYPDSRLTVFVTHAITFAASHVQTCLAVLVIVVTVIFTGAAFLMVRRQQVNV